MGRLGGLKYREVARRLEHFGFEYERPGAGSHEVWINRVTNTKVILPCHSKAIAEGTLRGILKRADIGVDDFLA